MNNLSNDRLAYVIGRLEHVADNVKFGNVGAAQELLHAADGLRELLALREAGKAPDINRNEICDKVYAKCSRIPGATFYNAAEFALDEIESSRAAPQLPAVPDGWVSLDDKSPYDAPYKIPAGMRELIAEEIGILFSEDDAQAIWAICRAAIAAAPKPE